MSTKPGKTASDSGSQPDGVPGGLPVFTTGWGAGNINFEDDAKFWDESNRLIAGGQLAGSIDSAMSGHSSPRVWLFLHEPGEAHLSVAAALNFARELGNRDQAVLLLDGDDDNADLTRWSGRTDLDGWVDLVRYGSSVLTCGTPMPFEGRRGYLLGVGSFTPADVTSVEVKDLLARLKRQADDILITAPADAVGRLWAAESDLRLLCWNRSQRSSSLVSNLLESFEAVGIPMTGLVGFGLPQQEEVVPPVPELPIVPTAASEILNELALEDDDIHEDVEFATSKGNSGIFWLIVVVSLLMISVAGGYYFKYVKVPSGGIFPVVTQNEDVEPNHTLNQASMSGTQTFDGGETNNPAIEQPSDDGADLIDTGEVETPSGQAKSDLDEIVPEMKTDEAASDLEAADLKLQEKPVVPVEEAPVKETDMAMEPYLGTVGSGGWALHVFSFPDSIRAEKEMSVLANKGFRSMARAIEFKDKGRWFRVYVGSFESKTEANAARSNLMEKLGEDWANPVRF